jgi:hypothetical protein
MVEQPEYLTEADAVFWSRVEKTDTCWFWQRVQSSGYGSFRLTDGGSFVAHRYAYERMIGPIPTGWQLDHLCRTPACVNPAHLEAISPSAHSRRHWAQHWGHRRASQTVIPERQLKPKQPPRFVTPKPDHAAANKELQAKLREDESPVKIGQQVVWTWFPRG